MGMWQGIETSGKPSGIIMAPENIPHYYNADGVLQVLSVSFDSAGNEPPDPPLEFQAPGYHRAFPPNIKEPQAGFGSDGICVASGYTPGGDWYNVGDVTEHPTGNSPASVAAKQAVQILVQFFK